MKPVYFIVCLLCLWGNSASAQVPKQIDVFGRMSCDPYVVRMQYAINASNQNPDAKMYIFVYEGNVKLDGGTSKRPTILRPIVGSARAKIRSMKKLISSQDVPLDRFVFIDGGFRDEPQVEIWLVPRGADPPKPSPTIVRMHQRKGTPSGFCVSCCGPV